MFTADRDISVPCRGLVNSDVTFTFDVGIALPNVLFWPLWMRCSPLLALSLSFAKTRFGSAVLAPPPAVLRGPLGPPSL